MPRDNKCIEEYDKQLFIYDLVPKKKDTSLLNKSNSDKTLH